MDSLIIAVQFLTRIPVVYPEDADDETLGQSLLYYPLVGFVLGVLLCASVLVLSASPEMMAAALVLAIWVWLTGGLHLDGLADCADAWVGGLGCRQRTLAIMKDPAAGPIAVIVLLLLLLLKWSALWVLIMNNDLLRLLAAPLMGRTAILLLMLSTPYVSPKGIAEKLLRNMPYQSARWVVVFSLAFAGLFLGWMNVLLGILLVLLIRSAAMARLGGVTGDVFGATVELVETATLLTAVLL